MVGDALIATRRADPETITARRRGWYGVRPQGTTAERRAAALSGAIRVMARHASLRSVWFLNSLRGSLALAAAVLVADQTGVQHGLWVVLGTLSVLRTSAASTGSTALRALGGTVIGFAAGALLLLGVGTTTPVLWAALPIAIAVAAYAPGTLPFAVGQAAFTVVVVVLFNLLQPVGWKLGLLRVQDMADLAGFYGRVAVLVGRPAPHEVVRRSVSRRSSAWTGTAAPFWLMRLVVSMELAGLTLQAMLTVAVRLTGGN